ncbi:DUF2071 domain-containing protein [Halococcus sp. IIIV-5B]|uniref:DUF2071 domain-containing protein n=1 Tax=Halococcus sp. IIIV-5B TaxID=2321230 RepID=UPI001F477EEF|nr:DUF2071 domain-containing protein [Halococcus sp. IIIV-5B]
MPEALSIDTHSGSAWISAVSVKLAEAKVRHVPRRPSATSVTLRTYVSYGDESGVYFLDLGIDDAIASWFGRLGFGMPYFHAQIEGGSLDEFLTERINYFFEAGPQLRQTIGMLNTGDSAPNGGGSGMFAGAAEHDPWEITSAEGTVDAGTLFRAAEVPRPGGEPRFNYAREQFMRMARIRELSMPTQG